jgi:hypothetical protein
MGGRGGADDQFGGNGQHGLLLRQAKTGPGEVFQQLDRQHLAAAVTVLDPGPAVNLLDQGTDLGRNPTSPARGSSPGS